MSAGGWAASDAGGGSHRLAVRRSTIGAFFGGPVEHSLVLSAELHCHSELSYDGRDPVSPIVDRAATLGLDVLAVTDHDAIDASLEAAALAADRGMVGIPGIEITSKAGHVIGLGVGERIQPGLPFEETLAAIRDAGGIAVVPHPFQKSRSGVAHNVSAAALAGADAIEIYNSRLLTGRGNRRAERFAEEHGLPITAGSDAHIAEMVGQAVTLVDAESPTVEGVVSAIREGRTEIGGSRTPWHISFRQAAGGVRRRVVDRLNEMF